MSLLAIESLSKAFGGNRVIDDLSLTVRQGAVHSIIGPNGAGKTTLFNLVSGIYTPESGRILLDGAETTGLAPYRMAALGLSRTFQNLQIFFNMSALENVMVGMHLHCDSRFLPAMLRLPRIVRRDAEMAEAAAGLLRFVGLAEAVGADADSLPYGALKRLEIARALATRPRLLLLDEPAAGLNPAETGEIDDLIQKIAETGVTVVLVEHDMRLVMGVSEHILVLDRGTLLAEGSGEEIRHNPDVVAAYLGEEGRYL
ncbi:MAG: ABC transporter ATP-binding protein [Rhodospirillales bacterium]|nr:MAG: ABC transporter ATP-binding protein [Rhodospirillales bacterium]